MVCLKSKRSATCNHCLLAALVTTLCGTFPLWPQTPPQGGKPQPDVLIFTNGEKLIGALESAQDDSVTFKSEMAGTVTVSWSKIEQLQTSRPFAVLAKNAKLRKHMDISGVPEGKLSMNDQKIVAQPASGAPHIIPVKDAGYVVEQPQFDKAITGNESILSNWGGTITAGASLIEATQKNISLTGAINLARVVPAEAWLNPSSRTLIDFNAAYGKVSQSGLPDIKTSIVHADAEQDKYFSPRLFVFGQTAFDHNYSLGLDLQYAIGGGLGWTAYKAPGSELDLKASVTYIHQNFNVGGMNQSLIGSTFSENYVRKFNSGLVLTQSISATPAWNNTNAFFGTAGITLAFPVWKRLSLSVTALDAFLNNPPPGFKKNSFQATLGLTYALK